MLALFGIGVASAASFSQLIVFGDSLSDTGNAYIATAGQFPGANYGSYTFANGLTTSFFSDGPNTTPVAAGPRGLWVDQLAGRLGLPDPTPSLATGTNFAVASAQTGTANPQDVGNYQLSAFALSHPTGAPSDALYAFWAGANDIIAQQNPVTAADNLESDIAALASQGARNFVWLNLPLLGDAPQGRAQIPPVRAALNAASVAFDGEWARDLAALQGSGVHVTGVDIESLFVNLIGNPSAYGLTNVTSAAQGANSPTDAGYLFWDQLHPTTYGHELVAGAVYNALVPTPEPASAALLMLGIFAVTGLAIKRRRA